MKFYKTTFFATWIVLGLAAFSCQSSSEKKAAHDPTDKAQQVIDRSIETHGGPLFENMAISFDFRDRHYTARRQNGEFEYTRAFTDTLGKVKDVLSNQGFYREVNGKRVELPEEKKTAFTNSVNSVIYFALLPYGLNDAAVKKEYLGETTLKGQRYHKIKVTFDQEGGGTDHEDQYLYWVNTANNQVDYLAYSFQVNEGGMRFREAANKRKINGILIADYVNYEPASDSLALEQLDEAYANGQLKKLSDINLEKVTVQTKGL